MVDRSREKIIRDHWSRVRGRPWQGDRLQVWLRKPLKPFAFDDELEKLTFELQIGYRDEGAKAYRVVCEGITVEENNEWPMSNMKMR